MGENEQQTDSIPQIMENIENSKDIPKEQIAIIEESLTMMSVIQNSSDSLMAKKITDKHIEKYLEDSGENMRLSYKDNTQHRIFLVAIIIVMTILIGFIIYTFKDSPDVIEKIILAAGGLISGGIGGYGLGKSKRD